MPRYLGRVIGRGDDDLPIASDLRGYLFAAVEQALDAGRTFAGGAGTPSGTLCLHPGDRICFTGQMSRPREELEAIAEAAGLRVTGSVSGKTAMLVCADAHSLSGKATKARASGTVVVSEPKFHQLLADLATV